MVSLESSRVKSKIYEVSYAPTTLYESLSSLADWNKTLKPDKSFNGNSLVIEILKLEPRDWYQELCISQAVSYLSCFGINTFCNRVLFLPLSYPQRRGRLHNVSGNISIGLYGHLVCTSLKTRLPMSPSSFLLQTAVCGNLLKATINRQKGFLWKGVYVKLLNDNVYQVKKEMMLQKYLAYELMEMNQGHNLITPLIATARYGLESLLVSACIFTKPEQRESVIEREDELNVSASVLNESRVQVDFCIENGLEAKEKFKDTHLLSRLSTTHLVPIRSSHRTFFVILNAETIVDEEVPLYRFIKIPSDVSESIEVKDFEENKCQPICKELEAFDWKLQISPSQNSDLKQNDRTKALLTLDSNKLMTAYKGDTLIKCRYYRTRPIESTKLDNAVAELNAAEYQYTFPALKELFHKHGVSMRYEWLVLEKMEKTKNKDVVKVDVLIRGVRKVVGITMKGKSITRECYIKTVAEYLKGIVNQDKEVLEKLRSALFFSKLRTTAEGNYSLSFLDNLLELSPDCYKLLLEGAEQLMGVKFDRDFAEAVKNDKYYLLSNKVDTMPITIQVKVKTSLTTREHCYGVLLSIAQFQRKYGDLTTAASSKKETSVLHSEGNSGPENYQTKRDKLPNKVVPDSLSRMKIMPPGNYSGNIRKAEQHEKHETPKKKQIRKPTANAPLTSIGPKLIQSSELRNSLSRSGKQCTPRVFQPKVNFPCCTADEKSGAYWASIKKHALPKTQEVLYEWIEYTKSLFEHLIVCEGSENICFEAIYMKALSALSVKCTVPMQCKECKKRNEHAVRSIMEDLKEILPNLLLCKAEAVLSMVLVLGLLLENINDYKKAVVMYIQGIKLYVKIYGDPRGRGSAYHPCGKLLLNGIARIAKKEKFIETIFLEDMLAAMEVQSEEKFPLQRFVDFESTMEWIVQNTPLNNSSGVLYQYHMVADLLQTIRDTTVDTVALWNKFAFEYASSRVSQLNGKVFCWGTNKHSELGTLENAELIPIPRLCVSLKDEYIISVACGHCCSFAINAYGQAFAWGKNQFGQLGLGLDSPMIVRIPTLIKGLPPIKQLASGNEHAVAVSRSGKVFTWGNGESGLLGHENCDSLAVPTVVSSLEGTHIKAVECGGLHTVALSNDGRLFTWGRAEGGQLGIPEAVLENVLKQNGDYYLHSPYELSFENETVKGIACGEAHTLAVTESGTAYGWGFCNFGQLGLGFTSDSFEPGTGNYKSTIWTPTKIESLKNVKKVTAGSTFSFFLSRQGELYSCGVNDFGQTGNEIELKSVVVKYSQPLVKNLRTTDVSEPKRLLCFTKIAIEDISAGENHAVAVSQDPETNVWSWGKIAGDEAKNGKFGKGIGPRLVPHLAGVKMAKVTCGSTHTMVLTEVEPWVNSNFQEKI
eukprot:TRINITY_DN1513_c0_g1_i1.p1 TRINITY_DN1513_c0_g1~~TRINITY_DN1513_c0_g1_i1.p1  ORF type:complete len:1386 (+),score=114.51 TRINITY_DN1513_c0_g1_i1:1826-5983(+)